MSAHDKGKTLFDVRTPSEWNAGHIEGALHIPANKILNSDQVDGNRPIAVICGGGFRSSIAASLLARHGLRNLSNVVGGMGAWKRTNLPTIEVS